MSDTDWKKGIVDPDVWWVHDLRNFDESEFQGQIIYGECVTSSCLRQALSESVRQAWKDGLFDGRTLPQRPKRCTVDGITIYESVIALRAALGQGLKGTRHPNFRLVD